MTGIWGSGSLIVRIRSAEFLAIVIGSVVVIVGVVVGWWVMDDRSESIRD